MRELTLGSEVPSHLIVLVHIQFISLEIKEKKRLPTTVNANSKMTPLNMGQKLEPYSSHS